MMQPQTNSLVTCSLIAITLTTSNSTPGTFGWNGKKTARPRPWSAWWTLSSTLGWPAAPVPVISTKQKSAYLRFAKLTCSTKPAMLVSAACHSNHCAFILNWRIAFCVISEDAPIRWFFLKNRPTTDDLGFACCIGGRSYGSSKSVDLETIKALEIARRATFAQDIQQLAHQSASTKGDL